MLAAAGLGVVIGTAVGLLGAGGSLLAIPALVYGVGQDVPQAVTTSLFVVGVSSIVGALPRALAGQIRWSISLVFGAAGIGTAFAGAAVGRLLPSQVLMLCFAALMVVVAVLMLVRRNGARPAQDARAAPPRVVASLGAGAAIGFLTGLFGVGGGFMIVPSLVLLLGLEMNLAIGTSLVITVINSAAGLAAHLRLTSIDWTVAAVFAGGAVVTSLLAARVGSRTHPDRLRRAFAALIVAVAAFVVVEAALT